MGAWALLREDVLRFLRLVGGPRRLGVLMVASLVGALLVATGPGLHRPDRGVFAVEVTPGSALEPAIRSDARFRVVEAAGSLSVSNTTVTLLDGRAGPAAYSALQEALEAWQEGQLRLEGDQAAAFPVHVDVVFVSRAAVAAALGPAAQGGPTNAPAVSELQKSPQSKADIAPAEVRAPFPLASLLLAFAYVIPMNFVSQLQAGALLADRTRRRGLLLLAAPIGPVRYVAGRSGLAAFISLGVMLAVTPAIGAGWGAMPAAIVMVAFPLALAAVLGLVARNERDLTFLLTGFTTLYAVYLFLPAVFSAVPQIAFLSPVSVVGASIGGSPVTAAQLALATIPLAVATLALAALAVGLAREETMFTPGTLTRKTVAGLSAVVRTRWRIVAAGVLGIPFAFALELLVLSLAIPLSLSGLFPIVLVGVAFVEEALKAAIAEAWIRRGGARWWGALSGVGFFLGEKAAFLLTLVGFGNVTMGPQALAAFGAGPGLALQVLPLALHAGTVALYIALRRRRLLAYGLAVLVHLAYNSTIVVLGGGA